MNRSFCPPRRFLSTALLMLALWAFAGFAQVQAAQTGGLPAPGEASFQEDAASSPEDTESFFDCYVTDVYGVRIHAYLSPQDGIYYLFVPHSVGISTMELCCEGEIHGASKGSWDPAEGVLRGAFQKSGDQAALELDGQSVQVKVLQSDLPSLELQLKDTTLAQVQKDKNIKYKGNSLYLTSAEGPLLLEEKESVEFKGRGNSSWTQYDKKGYQIKFGEKIPLLGMEAAKKWVLLANASDDSMIRNRIAMDLAEGLEMPYTSQFRYVDLWIDGDYQGTYLAGEKVEIGSGRIPLKDEKGVVMEQDYAFYEEEDYWIYDELLDTHMSLKESVEEEDPEKIREAIASFQEALDEFLTYLYRTPQDQVTLDELSARIDVDSFAKYYLAVEYTLNREANHTSYYWYRDGEGDVLHLGPVWDFDTCMGNEDLGAGEYYAHLYNYMMNRLLACPAFSGRVEEIRRLYDGAFRNMPEGVKAYEKEIASSAYMNYIRWNTLGGVNPKGFGDFAATYEDSVEKLEDWLKERYREFKVQKPQIAVAVSGDQTQMTVCCGLQSDNLVAAVWSGREPEDIQWYPAERTENGASVFTVDFGRYEPDGMYHIYVNGPENEGLEERTTYYRFPQE